jgi:UDP-N-acetylmuramate dehydrogenase
MIFPDLIPDLKARMPELRGRLLANQPLDTQSWFRVGGPAQVLFMPADENDLMYFLRRLPADIPVMVIGASSNLIIRDGGIAGVVIRLGRAFSEIAVEEGHKVRAGAAALDAHVARHARDASIAGLAFFSGIPGSIGGALRMNGGAFGGETKDVLIEARGIDRAGNVRSLSNAEMGFSYRNSSAPDDIVFTSALLQGRAGDTAQIDAEMHEIKRKREATQPKNMTCGSTFKNPPGQSAWKAIEAAGCRGLTVGGAQVSDKHCNFLLNLGGAKAADIEALGEMVRERVKAHSGVALEWEIKRVGVAS